MAHARNYRYWLRRKCKRLTVKAIADSNIEWTEGIKRYRLNLDASEFQPVNDSTEEPLKPHATPAEAHAEQWTRHVATAKFGSDTTTDSTIPVQRQAGTCTDPPPLMIVESTPSGGVGRARLGCLRNTWCLSDSGLWAPNKRTKLCTLHTTSECYSLDDTTDRDIDELREMLELSKDGLPVLWPNGLNENTAEQEMENLKWAQQVNNDIEADRRRHT